jgi:hypothetical protein
MPLISNGQLWNLTRNFPDMRVRQGRPASEQERDQVPHRCLVRLQATEVSHVWPL